MGKVSMFIPCTVDILMAEVGEAMYRVLRRVGVEAIYHEEQTCCGQPQINAGYLKEAREVAKHFIDVFGDDEVVVAPAGSCVSTVKHHYPEILSEVAGYNRRAEELAGRIYEFTEYLVDVLKVEDVGARFAGKVTYHESCHSLRGLGIADQPRKLLQKVQGLELVEMKNAGVCCGFGGQFALKYPELSEEMVKTRSGHFIDSGADLLVLCEPGCLLNIGGYLSRNHQGRAAVHIATLLAGNYQKEAPGGD